MSELEAHCTSCALCRNDYSRLSEVVGAIRGLPRAGEAPPEAWAGILSRIEAETLGGSDEESQRSDDTPVLRLPVGEGSSEGPPASGGGARRFQLTIVQLAAAAAIVALLSAGSVFIALDDPTAPVQFAGAPADVPGGAAARAVSLEDSRYVEVVDRLEQILIEGRTVLAAETLMTIEESLRTLDAAIDDIETALADDPNSDLLRRMLANHQHTKLGVLQRAAAAVQAQT